MKSVDGGQNTNSVSGSGYASTRITSGKLVEQHTDRKPTRWQLALDSSDQGVWDWDLETNQLYVSPGFNSLLGYESDDGLRTIDEWAALLHSDDKADVLSALESHIEGRTEDYRNVHRARHADGSYKWIEARGKVTDWARGGKAQRIIGTYTDITPRKELESALRASEQRIRQITAQIPGVVYQIKRSVEGEFSIPYVSEGAASFVQVAPEDSREDGMHWFSKYSEEDRSGLIAGLAESARTLTSWHEERKILLPADGYRWMETSATPMAQADGSVLWHGYARDITARKEAALALQASEQRLRDIAARVPGVVYQFCLSAEGKFTLPYASDKIFDLLGVTADEVRDDGAQAFRYIDAGSLPAHVASIQESARTLTPWTREFPITCPGEERKWLSGESLPMKQVDGSVLWTGFLADITERKQLEGSLHRLNAELEQRVASRTKDLEVANLSLASKEEQLRAIVQNMADGLIICDSNGVICGANPAIESVFGYSANQVTFQHISLLLPASNWPYLTRNSPSWQQQDDMTVAGVRRKVTGRHSNGREIPIDMAISSYVVDGATFSIGLLRDISEHQLTLAALSQARDEADQGSRAKSAFLAAMSHEIRTPMNGVIGMAEVLCHAKLPDEQAELVETIHVSALNLLGVLDEILDFSKIEAGKLQLDIEPMSVESLVESVCNALEPVATNNGVNLTLFCDPKIPAELRSDPLRLRQIITNLISNAIKFSGGRPEQPGHVAVRVDQVGADDGIADVRFRVIDNGIGMTAETVGQLFSPFVQAEVSTTRRFGGSGLGLSIAQRLAQLLYGRIEVESTPGEGSVFTVILSMEIHTRHTAPPYDFAGIGCVIVGEDAQLGRDWKCYLEHCGAWVRLVENASDAARELPMLRGMPTVIIYSNDAAASFDTLSIPDDLDAGMAVDVRKVFITRGRRRAPRVSGSNDVILDGSVVHRTAFLHAVALAARLVSPDDLTTGAAQQALPSDRHLTQTGAALENGQLILVAEDNDINRKVIQHQLHLLGYAAELANNGHEALARWRTGQYGLVLSDLHMPEMDGYELTAAIREEEAADAHTPIIAFTANAIKGEQARCIEVGMDDYLTKPVQLPALKSLIERWLPQTVAGTVPVTVVPTSDLPNATTDPWLDLDILKEIVGDEPAVMAEFLAEYLVSLGQATSELRAAREAGNACAIMSIGHRLKSSSRAVGALHLGEICAAFEQAGKTGGSAACERLMGEYERATAAVEGRIRAVLTSST